MAGFSYPTGACACFRDKCSYDCETYSRWNPKPATNADRIRAMSDEELAKWIAEEILHLTGGSLDMATEAWIRWMKKEAGGGD